MIHIYEGMLSLIYSLLISITPPKHSCQAIQFEPLVPNDDHRVTIYRNMGYLTPNGPLYNKKCLLVSWEWRNVVLLSKTSFPYMRQCMSLSWTQRPLRLRNITRRDSLCGNELRCPSNFKSLFIKGDQTHISNYLWATPKPRHFAY